MKYMNMNCMATVLSATLITGLTSCGGGGGTASGSVSDKTPTGELSTELTKAISFTSGSIVDSAPPAANFTANDPFISAPIALDLPVLTPGEDNVFTVQVNQVPLDTTGFKINIQFDTSTSQYISIIIDDPDLISNIASSGGTGNINLPLSLSSTACDNLDNVQYLVEGVVFIELIDGTSVSAQVAQKLVLSCGSKKVFTSKKPAIKIHANFYKPGSCLYLEVKTGGQIFSSNGLKDATTLNGSCGMAYDYTDDKLSWATFTCDETFSDPTFVTSVRKRDGCDSGIFFDVVGSQHGTGVDTSLPCVPGQGYIFYSGNGSSETHNLNACEHFTNSIYGHDENFVPVPDPSPSTGSQSQYFVTQENLWSEKPPIEVCSELVLDDFEANLINDNTVADPSLTGGGQFTLGVCPSNLKTSNVCVVTNTHFFYSSDAVDQTVYFPENMANPETVCVNNFSGQFN